jgi:hypothetical protein
VAGVLLYSLTVDVELARQQWEDGRRRLEDARADRGRYVALQEQVDVLVDALRKRVGQVFTLDELAAAYDGADEWARTVLEDVDPEAPPAPEAGTVADAAFHAFARGAADYRP